jgi:DNA invertase Pin-like site-specific DNA recombinase
MAKRFGYARVSTDDQNLEVQTEALKVAGCDVILAETASGKSRDGRPKLALLMEVIGPGDALVVTKLDRLARKTLDMLELAETIGRKGAGFKSLAEPWADTTTPEAKLIFTIFAGFAEWERERIRQRQSEGIARAKAKGIYKGRPPSIDRARVLELKAAGMGPAAIARELRIGESSVYRVLKEAAAGNVVPIRKEA